MYKLAVADDEAAVVEGLRDIVDWASMGFELVCTASDGRGVIEYIDRYPVDVILTDIKMTFVSGLDVAKYVAQTGKDCRVVVLSGYQEFELARRALQYRVKYYLLKPTNLSELRSVFHSIRQELDNERSQMERRRAGLENYQNLLRLYQEQFFTDLLMGAIRTPEALDRRIPSCLKIEPANCALTIVCFAFHEGKGMESPETRRQIFDTMIRGTAEADEKNRYFMAPGQAGRFQVAALSPARADPALFERQTVRFLQRVAEKYRALFGVCLHAEAVRTFSSLYEAATCYQPMVPVPGGAGDRLEDALGTVDLDRLTQQKKLFLSYINCDDLEMARGIFENCMDELTNMKVGIIQNFAIDLFAAARDRLEKLGVDMGDSPFDYRSVLQFGEVLQIRKWGLSLLDDVADHVRQCDAALSSGAVEKAKRYIGQNCCRDIGLEEVAAQVFLSPIYFSHLFKRKTGMNFIDFLTEMRIRRAKELLGDRRLKIDEVSREIGYRSTKYFYKIFKDRTGATPTEYRNRLRGSRAAP